MFIEARILQGILIYMGMGPFIKDVINRGGFAKIWCYLISLFSKNDEEGGGERGQKSQKIDDVFYEQPLSETD